MAARKSTLLALIAISLAASASAQTTSLANTMSTATTPPVAGVAAPLPTYDEYAWMSEAAALLPATPVAGCVFGSGCLAKFFTERESAATVNSTLAAFDAQIAARVAAMRATTDARTAAAEARAAAAEMASRSNAQSWQRMTDSWAETNRQIQANADFYRDILRPRARPVECQSYWLGSFLQTSCR